MKSVTIISTLAILALASCQRSTPPNSNYADNFCLTEGCDCEEGYKGNQCDERIVPSSVTIHAIELLDHPVFNNGESWDAYEGSPDVAFTLSHGHEIVFESEVIASNLAADEKVLVSEVQIELTDVLGEYRIRLLDLDPEEKSDEIMADLYFKAFDRDRGPVDILPIKEGDARLVLHLEYDY